MMIFFPLLSFSYTHKILFLFFFEWESFLKLKIEKFEGRKLLFWLDKIFEKDVQKQKWEEKTKELHVWKLKDQKKKRKYRESDNREVKSRGGTIREENWRRVLVPCGWDTDQYRRGWSIFRLRFLQFRTKELIRQRRSMK